MKNILTLGHSLNTRLVPEINRCHYCLISAGINQACEYAVGGIDRIIAINRSELIAAPDITDATDADYKAVQGFVLKSGAVGYELEFDAVPGSEIATGNRGSFKISAGAMRHFEQSVVYANRALTQQSANQLEKMGLANVVLLVHSRSGKWFLFFYSESASKNGGWVTVGENNLGVAAGDRAGQDLTMMGVATNIAPELITPLATVTYNGDSGTITSLSGSFLVSMDGGNHITSFTAVDTADKLIAQLISTTPLFVLDQSQTSGTSAVTNIPLTVIRYGATTNYALVSETQVDGSALPTGMSFSMATITNPATTGTLVMTTSSTPAATYQILITVTGGITFRFTVVVS